MPVWKKLLFGLAVTAALLGLIELSLAVAGSRPLALTDDPYVGFAGYSPLFVEHVAADGTVMMTRSPAKARYFNEQQFSRNKPAGAVRIFCLGGSTTFGRPYEDSTSYCGWLRRFLPIADPSRKWEVINVGGISYASYRLAALTDELAGYSPDVLVIHTGHNEFLERRTYGDLMARPQWVRSLYGILNRTRTYSAASRLLRPADTGPRDGRDLMGSEVQTLLDRSVGPSDYSREMLHPSEAIDHFRHNINRMIDLANQAGARALLVVPASNLADCSPFKSEHQAGLAASAVATFETHMAAARQAMAASQFDQAAAAAQAALAIDDRYAEAHYVRGKALQKQGKSEAALAALLRARDEDVCPLRAPSEFEQAVREIARTRNVALVDFARRVSGHAPGGITGAEQFLDHVHPTIEEHRDLALGLLNALVAEKVARSPIALDAEAIERVTREVNATLTPHDRARALRTLGQVLGWAGKFDESSRLLDQADAMDPDGGTADSLTNRGITLQMSGKNAQAVEQFQRALQRDSRFSRAHSAMANALAALNKFDQAESHIRQAIALDPANPVYHFGLGEILLQRGKTTEAAASFQRVLASDKAHVRAMVRLGQIDLEAKQPARAQTYFQQAVAANPRDIQARVGLGLSLSAQGRGAEALAEFQSAAAVDGDSVYAAGNLAWLLATCPQDQVRNGPRAVELAAHACALTQNRLPEILDVQAAAYAEAGRFPEAVETATRAVALAEEQNKAQAAAVIRQRLELYRRGKCFREEPPR